MEQIQKTVEQVLRGEVEEATDERPCPECLSSIPKAATRCAGPVSRASLVSVSVVIGALSGNKKSGPRDRDPLAISTFVAM